MNWKGLSAIGGATLSALLGLSYWLDGKTPPPAEAPSALMGAGPVSMPEFNVSAKPPVPPEPAPVVRPDAPPARLVASPANLAVQATTGAAVRTAVRISNQGGQKAEVSVVLEGSGDLTIDQQTCAKLIEPGQTCVTTLLFRPTQGGPQEGKLLVQPVSGDPLVVALAAVGIDQVLPPPTPQPPDKSARDSIRDRRLGGMPQGPGTPPSDNASKEQRDQYESRRAQFRMVNTVPEAALSQPDYGGYASYGSSLPVDNCRIVAADSVIAATTMNFVDSSQCGEVRALVDRHVYNSGGSCRNILIPAGSTLIGECTGVGSNRERLDVRWRRIIRAGDRAHILIEEAASDAMGRKGVPGHVESGTERLLLATLLGAAVNAATGGLIGALDRSTVTSAIDITTGLATSSQQNKSPAGEAARAFGQTMASGVQELVQREAERLRSQNPVTLPPGTRLTIIPTTDLVIRSPAQGPMVMGETQSNLGQRLNPQFQPMQSGAGAVPAAGAQSSYGPGPYGNGPYSGGAYGGPYPSGGSSGYQPTAPRGGVVQVSPNGVIPPGQGGTMGSVSVQRVTPGSSW